ncbi:hypothetical protein HHL24_27110 [Paraburkholderia sp. RP-4-7]|uniref:Uncharacterized protein n=1 Tax=Paraburkholderia polaris TaxID=2728848 RepID=A0A848IP60_9BURK|nr:hypothetical protein [Paraburkholderia polaris]NMM01595.1 hypothetical protein [Paraburkholderia polaris]
MRTTVHLFHFPPASERSAHGAASAFVVGVNDQLDVYLSEPHTLAADSANLLQDVLVDVLRRGDLDDSEHVARLLRGKHPSDFEIGEEVDDGTENHGTYAGIHEVDIPDRTICIVPIESGGWSFSVTSSSGASAFGSRGHYATISEAVRAARQMHGDANIEVLR